MVKTQVFYVMCSLVLRDLISAEELPTDGIETSASNTTSASNDDLLTPLWGNMTASDNKDVTTEPLDSNASDGTPEPLASNDDLLTPLWENTTASDNEDVTTEPLDFNASDGTPEPLAPNDDLPTPLWENMTASDNEDVTTEPLDFNASDGTPEPLASNDDPFTPLWENMTTSDNEDNRTEISASNFTSASNALYGDLSTALRVNSNKKEDPEDGIRGQSENERSRDSGIYDELRRKIDNLQEQLNTVFKYLNELQPYFDGLRQREELPEATGRHFPSYRKPTFRKHVPLKHLIPPQILNLKRDIQRAFLDNLPNKQRLPPLYDTRRNRALLRAVS